ncbi:hypothetical protein MC885_021786 [Smutsia gigantea]|nr:hypothetical protein MC885_021786 [Smutsia gigantea]
MVCQKCIPRPETTVTSEGDHIPSANDCELENDFSTTGSKLTSLNGRQKAEVELHIIKSSTHLTELNTLTGTTYSGANDSTMETFIPVKIGNISSPIATVSLLDFSINTAKEDILLEITDAEDGDVSIASAVSGTLKEATANTVKPSVTADEAVPVTDSFIPDTDICPAAEKNFNTIPDITAFTKEKITEIDLILPEDSPNAVPKLADPDEEMFLTLFELTTIVKRDKDNPEGILLTDEESWDAAKVWMEKEIAHCC